MFFKGNNRGTLLGGGLLLPVLGLLVVIVTPILPDSLLRTSAFLFVPSPLLGNSGISTLLLELSESTLNVDANSGGVGDSWPSKELGSVSSSGATGFKRGAEVLPVVDSSWLSSPTLSSPPGSSSTTRLANTCSWK